MDDYVPLSDAERTLLQRSPALGTPHSADGGSFYRRFRGPGYVPPPRKQSWLHAAFVLVAELVGTGVLGLPQTFAIVGPVYGVMILLVFSLLSLYSGLLLHRLQDWFSQGITYGDMAFEVYGFKGQQVVFGFIYIAFFGNLAIYLLTCAETLQNVFYDSKNLEKLPLTIATGLFLLPFCQLRTLHHVSYAASLSAAAIFIALCIILAIAVSDKDMSDTLDSGRDISFSLDEESPPGFLKTMAAITTAIFAFGGQGLYFETMAEMRNPNEFPKAVALTTVLILCVYLVVTLTCYSVYGKSVKSNILFALPETFSKRVASALTFFHVCISYVLAQQVIGRAIHVRVVHHDDVDSGNRREKFYWFATTVGLLLTSLFIANAIPIFKHLMGLVAALSTAPLTFGIPALMIYHGSKMLPSLPAQHKRISDWEYPILLLFVVLSIYLMTVGLVSNTSELIKNWHSK